MLLETLLVFAYIFKHAILLIKNNLQYLCQLYYPTFKEIKLLSFLITENNVLEKYGFIWKKIQNLNNISLTPLPIHNNLYIKIRT